MGVTRKIPTGQPSKLRDETAIDRFIGSEASKIIKDLMPLIPEFQSTGVSVDKATDLSVGYISDFIDFLDKADGTPDHKLNRSTSLVLLDEYKNNPAVANSPGLRNSLEALRSVIAQDSELGETIPLPDIEKVRALVSKTYKALDTNGDGKINLDEVKSGLKEKSWDQRLSELTKGGR